VSTTVRTQREAADGATLSADEFEIGSQVVYPSHGVARIVRREERVFLGETCWYLVLALPETVWGASGGLTLSVPEASAAELGIRPAISADDAADILEMLAVRDLHMPSNWSRRFKNHQEKLKSGDVYQHAEVVRNLASRLRIARLSAGERTMYAKARYVLISELAVSWDVDLETASARVDQALEPPPAAPVEELP
jgi:CarD family transcriptional regulator